MALELWTGWRMETLLFSPNKLYLPEQIGDDQLDNVELDGLMTLKILDEVACDDGCDSSKMMDVMEDREVGWLNLELLPP